MRTTVRTVFFLLALASGLFPAAAGAQATSERGACVTVRSDLLVQAAPARVWDALISAKGFCALTGLTATAPGLSLGSIGNTVPAARDGEAGMLVATRVTRNRELRVSFEPDSGGYLLHEWVTLVPEGKGCRLLLVERFTAEQAAEAQRAERQAVAARPRQLAAFKALAETGR